MMVPLLLLPLPLLLLLLMMMMMAATQTAASDYSMPSHSLHTQVTHAPLITRITHHMSRLTHAIRHCHCRHTLHKPGVAQLRGVLFGEKSSQHIVQRHLGLKQDETALAHMHVS